MRGMRWRMGLAVLALCAILAGLLPHHFAATSASDSLKRQIERATGLVPELAPGATLKLLPWPRLRFDHLTLRQNGHIKLEAKAIEVPLAPNWPAIWKRSGLNARLISPSFSINLDHLLPDWAQPDGALVFPALAKALPDVVRHLALADAHITLIGSNLRQPLTLEHVAAIFESRGKSGPEALRFAGMAGGGPFTGRAWFGRASHGANPVDLAISGPWAAGASKGYWHVGAAAYVGNLEFASRSQRWIMGFKGPVTNLLHKASQVELNAHIKLLRGQIDASDIRGSVDGQSFRGLVALERHGTVNRLSGTLAAQQWVLPDAILNGDLLARNPITSTSMAPSGRNRPPPLAVDLRVSVAHLIWRTLNLSNLALALSSHGGPLKLDLAQADLGGGTLRGAIVVDSHKSTKSLQAALHVSKIPISAICRLLVCPDPFSGLLTADASLTAALGATQSLATALSGHGAFILRHGALPGPDLGRWLRWQARHEGPLPPIANAEGTVYNQMSGEIYFKAGGPAALAFSLASSALHAKAAGVINPATMTLDLKASARQILSAPSTTETPAKLNFKIKGSLTHPRLSMSTPLAQ